LAKRDVNSHETTIFYMANRCDNIVYSEIGINLTQYNRLNFLLFIIKNIFKTQDEVCIPHMRNGNLIKFYIKYARSLSVVDDGMDTLRDRPRNINPNDFKKGSKYYTFKYDFDLPCWLNSFSVDKVCDIKNMSISSRPQAVLEKTDTIIVESPGVEGCDLLINGNKEEILLVKHTNKNKDTIKHACVRSISGINISLEKTIQEFQGRLIVGESMVAVFALMQVNPRYRISVYLTRDSVNNLTQLVKLIKSSNFADLIVV